ncbi:PEP-CTERM sorting domain-containing protein [Photobacterium sp. TLY01]|uniref:PEP-CTERM sorting domain-containing protein n=1 Tax=Photobacterium sp. TLY01 TaxID=2907534 RepID=UPI001F3C6D09|nr:PEP-CTERM sorting domain-containing protein [Photobacterium sp. TLY01]UIP29735.1 PEP-CTERM sorting domain-containing protein [Photobacterium sp. TLY01]
MKMSSKFRTVRTGLYVSGLLLSSASQAGLVDIFAFSSFFSPNNTDVYVDTPLDNYGIGYSDVPYNFVTSFTSALDGDNYGTLQWNIKNNTGSSFTDIQIVGVLDAVIDFYGDDDYAYNAGNSADSWEINDSYDLAGNFFYYGLALNNSVTQAFFSHGLALGFNISEFSHGSILSFTYTLKDNGPGLHLTDHYYTDLYFDGTYQVPEPGSLLLFTTLLFGAGVSLRRRLKINS